jgi:hypothetical protein
MGGVIGYLFSARSIMKAVRIVPILSLFAVASAAYVWLHSSPEISSLPEPIAMPGGQQAVVRMAGPATNEASVEEKVPVQLLEERGDAMLFEIDALQNTPFDEAIVAPFD